MNYSCGIIRDLLPLYVDDAAGDESCNAIEMHLSECEECMHYFKAMKESDGFSEKRNSNSEDTKMADSLKKIKRKINKKIRNIIISSAAILLAVFAVFVLLFSVPLKKISVDDISVSADVYPISEIAKLGGAEDESVKITIKKFEKDNSELYNLEIPAFSQDNISITENIVDTVGFVSVISLNCPYVIKKINYADGADENAIYIEDCRSTILNNKAEGEVQTSKSLEFKEINKIIYLENGQEQVLWSR